MPTISIRNSMIGFGITLQDNASIVADGGTPNQETVPAGKAGTAGAAGVMTLGSSHGFTDADTVSVWWATGFRYGCAISSYDGTTVTVNGATGTGDSLPTSGAVILSKKVNMDTVFTGSNLAALGLGADVNCLMALEDAGGVEFAATITAGRSFHWDSGNNYANPVTGDSIVKCSVYNKQATAGTATVMTIFNNAA